MPEGTFSCRCTFYLILRVKNEEKLLKSLCVFWIATRKLNQHANKLKLPCYNLVLDLLSYFLVRLIALFVQFLYFHFDKLNKYSN